MGTARSSSEGMTSSDSDTPKDHLHSTGTQSEHGKSSETSKSETSSQSEIFSSYNNIYNNSSDCKTARTSQSEITTEYYASSEPSSREASRPSSPESGNFTARTMW